MFPYFQNGAMSGTQMFWLRCPINQLATTRPASASRAIFAAVAFALPFGLALALPFGVGEGLGSGLAFRERGGGEGLMGDEGRAKRAFFRSMLGARFVNYQNSLAGSSNDPRFEIMPDTLRSKEARWGVDVLTMCVNACASGRTEQARCLNIQMSVLPLFPEDCCHQQCSTLGMECGRHHRQQLYVILQYTKLIVIRY
jgi:hypothetical protein